MDAMRSASAGRQVSTERYLSTSPSTAIRSDERPVAAAREVAGAQAVTDEVLAADDGIRSG
jgi:hypothetical protein